MKLLPHQQKAVEISLEKLNKYNFAYIFGEPRIGKSLISLEVFKNQNKVMVLTKKGAIKDWLQYKEHYKNYDVINYEQVLKYNPKNYTAVVIDESHNFSTIPKPSQRIKQVKAFCKDKPLLLLSGTPIVESPLGIYHQFYLSSFSPFLEFKNFYSFFKAWGIPCQKHLAGRVVETYKQAKPLLLNFIEPYIIKVSYQDAGFNYRNKDKVIYIELCKDWLKFYNNIKKSNFIGKYPLENPPALYQCLHQVEGGLYKEHLLRFTPKLDWLKEEIAKHKGKKIAVMSYFVGEQNYLSDLFKRFKNVKILSSTKYCEGVDLSNYDIFILYSFGYSGAKFIQLRNRIVNITKDKETFCYIPLIKGGICEDIYKVVKEKRNFNINFLLGDVINNVKTNN